MIAMERRDMEERKKIHVVKHLPKADEEILDELIKKHSEQNTSSMRRAKKDAATELANKKQVQSIRDQRQADASEVSDVETVYPSNALFSVDVNLDNLKDHLGALRTALVNQDVHLRRLE